jgi:galactokinase
MDNHTLERSFSAYFNSKPKFLVRAPGRVNLIGEHTDYNDGFVLPMAIERAVWIAVRPRPDRQVRIISLDLGADGVFDLGSLERGEGWIEYIKGVADQLQQAGHSLRGFEAVMSGNVPRGAGLSSSAAVELAAARVFSALSAIPWEPADMARLAQKAENEWVGVKCGIMDQMASAAARAGCALFLDCRSLETSHVPLPRGVSIVIMDTSTRRGLVDSAYNERRRQCETAARGLGVQALRDADLQIIEGLQAGRGGLDETTVRRARHIITENGRVLDAVQAMHAGDARRLGGLFDSSHASLRDDFEVSSRALDLIVECAREQDACYGARMTGAGFGGCALALVEEGETDRFIARVTAAYRERSGMEPAMYVTGAGEGASLVEM